MTRAARKAVSGPGSCWHSDRALTKSKLEFNVAKTNPSGTSRTSHTTAADARLIELLSAFVKIEPSTAPGVLAAGALAYCRAGEVTIAAPHGLFEYRGQMRPGYSVLQGSSHQFARAGQLMARDGSPTHLRLAFVNGKPQ